MVGDVGTGPALPGVALLLAEGFTPRKSSEGPEGVAELCGQRAWLWALTQLLSCLSDPGALPASCRCCRRQGRSWRGHLRVGGPQEVQSCLVEGGRWGRGVGGRPGRADSSGADS